MGSKTAIDFCTNAFQYLFFVRENEQFETAAAEVLVSLKSRVAGETGEMEEPVPGEVQVLLRSEQDPASMRSLGVSVFNSSSFLSFFFSFFFIFYVHCTDNGVQWRVGTIYFKTRQDIWHCHCGL